MTVHSTDDADELGAQLAGVAPEQTLHAVDVGAVPTGAVAAVGEQSDGEHAERPVDAVHGDGADGVVDLHPSFHEPHGLDDEDSGDHADHHGHRRRHEGAGCGDGHEAGEHAVGHHSRLRLAGAAAHPQHRHDRAEGPAIAVLAATTANCTSVAANVEAALKPNQPNSRMNVPSIAIGMW